MSPLTAATTAIFSNMAHRIIHNVFVSGKCLRWFFSSTCKGNTWRYVLACVGNHRYFFVCDYTFYFKQFFFLGLVNLLYLAMLKVLLSIFKCSISGNFTSEAYFATYELSKVAVILGVHLPTIRMLFANLSQPSAPLYKCPCRDKDYLVDTFFRFYFGEGGGIIFLMT